MKFGRALFNSVATSFVWAFRIIITWASPAAPSVSSVIATFAFAALARMKRMYSREVEPNQLLLSTEGKLPAVAAWDKGKAGPVDVAQGMDPKRTTLAEGTDGGRDQFSPKDQAALRLCQLSGCKSDRNGASPDLRAR
jgi:hypothetical protein